MAPSKNSSMAQIKTKIRTSITPKASPKVNTPSNTAASPMAQANASSPVNASTSPGLTSSFKLDNAPEPNSRTNTKPRKLEPNLNTTQSKPAHDPSKPYRCIICNNKVVAAERKQHFNGQHHKQTAEMLRDYRRRQISKLTLPKPDSKMLKVHDDTWYCAPCVESMQPPFTAKVLQKHLADDKHDKALGKLWRNLKHRLGFSDTGKDAPEIPQDFDGVFRRISNRMSDLY